MDIIRDFFKGESIEVKSEGEWKEGKKDGLWKTYYGNRKLKAVGNWKKGKKDGLWTNYHLNGRFSSKESWIEGKKDGLWKIYYNNDIHVDIPGNYGFLESEGNYKNDMKEGLWKLYYEITQHEYEWYLTSFFENITFDDVKGKLLVEGNWKEDKQEYLFPPLQKLL